MRSGSLHRRCRHLHNHRSCWLRSKAATLAAPCTGRDAKRKADNKTDYKTSDSSVVGFAAFIIRLCAAILAA